MWALRRISASLAQEWQRGRLRGQSDIDRLSPTMMAEFSDPKGLSVWLAETQNDIENIAAAITFQHGKGCADCTFASAPWAAVEQAASAVKVPGGTGCSLVDPLHWDVSVPDHRTHVQVVSAFLQGPAYTVPQSISKQRILDMVGDGIYSPKALIRALPASQKAQIGDSLIVFAKEGLMELCLATHSSLTYSWRRVPGD